MIANLMIFLAGIMVGVGLAVFSCHKMADTILDATDKLITEQKEKENKDATDEIE